MTEQRENETTSLDVPEAVIRTKKSFSIVWLIPLVAVLIGGWLVYKALSEMGPRITITFNTAAGLEAGKTKIKHKDVEIGKVVSIRLSKDLSQVVVTAELSKGIESYLTDRARFWVVRARIRASEVSGLGTLFSGAYIALDPGKGGKPLRAFTGLETPPIATADIPGRHFLLRADRLHSLDTGSPVYFRQIEVGQVESYELDEYSRKVDIKVFIYAPHDRLVHKNTRFWNAGGLDVSIDANGVRIDTPSFVSLMIGGVAFTTPIDLESGGFAEDGDVFPLYDNYQDALRKSYSKKEHWVLNFDGSVRGLSHGSPVEFKGIRIGRVVDVNLQFDVERLTYSIPVLIEIEPERINTTGKLLSDSDRRKFMDDLVAKGFRAQLKTGNLLTGQMFVDLGIHPGEPTRHIIWNDEYPELPTVQAPLEKISAALAQTLDKLQKLPLEEIGSEVRTAVQSLNETLKQTRMLVQKLDAKFEPEARATLVQAQKTLASVENVLSSDSPLNQKTSRAMVELAAAARSIRVLMDYLERHPDSLLFGKGNSK
ncbi:MAG: MCE family protein [Deltaproteobacteria bacterium]|nr:MCE family protein [Deltaproteobacteria bacterium]